MSTKSGGGGDVVLLDFLRLSVDGVKYFIHWDGTGLGSDIRIRALHL